MKYRLLFCLSIIAFAHANTPFQDPFPHHQPNKETNEGWGPLPEANPTETNNQQTTPTSGILADEVLTAKRKKLDPELADLVINTSEASTQELAQIIQECAKNQNKKCPAKALLVGAPGIGKTTYIQAVAEKANIPFIKINSAFVSDKYKDSGPDNLKAIFKSILQTKTTIIVAFDELHCLTDSHKNSNNPNQNTAEALWLLMDQCAENPNIILVGIMNDGSNMPEQIKSRFKTDTYIMKSSDEIAQKQQILKHYLKKFKSSCDEKCQKTVSKSLKSAEARVIEGVVESANRTASLGKEEWQITQKDLESAIKRSNDTQEVFETKKETIPARELTNWEKAGYAGAAAGGTGALVAGITGGINQLDQVAQRHGGWQKVWEDEIKPKLGFLQFILKIIIK